MEKSNQWYNPYVQSPGGVWVPGVPVMQEVPSQPPPKISRQVRRQAERKMQAASKKFTVPKFPISKESICPFPTDMGKK